MLIRQLFSVVINFQYVGVKFVTRWCVIGAIKDYGRVLYIDIYTTCFVLWARI
jgi:hypothetical protein